MSSAVCHEQIATARVVARAAQQRWQRTRSGIDRLIAETLGTELAALELAALDARNKAGRL